MATVVLELQDIHDLDILRPLLKRLDIVVHDEPYSAHQTPNIEELDAAFDQLNALNTFGAIQDVVEWQKQQRDEWN
jgi:hypothetical protein